MSRSIFLVLIFAFQIISEDFNTHHLANIDSKEVLLRINYGQNSERAKHYYSRVCVKTPAETINKNMREGDLVVSVFMQAPDYYLDRLDYLYRNHSTDEGFLGISRLRGTREIWTNASLIHSDTDLYDFLDNAESTVWLITYSEKFRGAKSEDRLLSKIYSRQLYYSGLDGNVNVFKVSPEDKPSISRQI